MPFSSLHDPVEVARATAAMEKAWGILKERLPADANLEAERANLASIVLMLAPITLDENELAERAAKRAYLDRV